VAVLWQYYVNIMGDSGVGGGLWNIIILGSSVKNMEFLLVDSLTTFV